MEQIEGRNARNFGARVQGVLRARFGAHAAKKAARVTGADLRTARGWVDEGRAPSGDHLLKIIAELGRDGLIALFAPEIETHDEGLAREIAVLEAKAEDLRARLRASGPAPENPLDETPPAIARRSGGAAD